VLVEFAASNGMHAEADKNFMPNDDKRIILKIAYPEEEQVSISPPKLDDFCNYCLSVKPPSDFADRAQFDVFNLEPWLGQIIILEDLAPEDDFRYRMYGTLIADAIGWDMTGRRVSDYDPVTRDYNTQFYRECVQQRRLIYSVNRRVYGRFAGTWHRIVCPVKAGEQIQVVACNYHIPDPPQSC